jgi:amidohydrolase
MSSDRRWLHAHPELSFKEVETSAYVASKLKSYGITEMWEKVGRTGIVAVIRGAHPGPTIALRADMDALPIQETGDCPFISQNAGVMHACGHDGHISMLLAATQVILAMRGSLKGNVKLFFQPAEEGFGGAREMIKDGCLTDKMGPKVDFVFGAHLWSYDAVGRVGARHGPMMAASDKWEIHVNGKGGHGAAPQGTVDAVVVAANVVTALQTVVSRNKDPLEAGVLTCGTLNGGHGYNIIADKVKITGTCRSFTKDTQELMKERMRGLCCGIGQAYGAEVSLDYHYGYPPTVNTHKPSVDAVHKAAAKIVGAEGSGVPYITCGAEDFSYFLEACPGAFFFVGASLPDGELRPHHRADFDFDERALAVGASVFVQLIEDMLVAKE